MIPQGWQPIGEPDVPELSPDAQKVQAYLAEHGIDKLTKRQEMAMRIALRMGFDRLRDAVYEFRKWEAIMAKRLTEEEKSKIIALHEAGETNRAIASKVCCSPQTVSNVLQAEKLKQDLETEKKPVATVNKEFDDAINQMIEEAKTPTEAVQVQPAELEPVYTDKLPPVVLRAIRYSLSDMESEIESREERIAELQIEIAEFRKDIDALKAWREAHT